MNNFNFKSYDTSKQSISYCEVDKCKAVIKLREQLEAYKMEAEEGKEINAELKAENKHLNGLLDQALKELEQSREAIEKIKDIAQDFGFNGIYEDCFTGIQQILQICDEVNEC